MLGDGMIPAWLLSPAARASIAATLLSLAFAAGWSVNGWRMGATIELMEHERTQEVMRVAASARAREKELQREMDARQAAWELAESEIHRRLQDARNDNLRLRADVDAGRKRLRVAATCPDPNRLPGSSAATGVDHGAGAELTASARSDYFALRDGIEQVTRQLEACQGRLK